MTLQQYRAIPDETTKKVENHAPMFGMYVGAHRTGYVSVGDAVYIGCDGANEWTTWHPINDLWVLWLPFLYSSQQPRLTPEYKMGSDL